MSNDAELAGPVGRRVMRDSEHLFGGMQCAACGAKFDGNGKIMGSAWNITDLFDTCGIDETTLGIAIKMAKNVGDIWIIKCAMRQLGEAEVARLSALDEAHNAELTGRLRSG
jgi:hypothetical protein